MAGQTEIDDEENIAAEPDPSRAEIDRILGRIKRDTDAAQARQSRGGYQPTAGLRQSYSNKAADKADNPDSNSGQYSPGSTQQKNPPPENNNPNQGYSPGSTKAPGFQPLPEPRVRSGLEDAAYQAGRGVGDLRRAWGNQKEREARRQAGEQPADQEQAKETGSEKAKAPANIEDTVKSFKADPKQAAAQLADQALGAGTHIGDILFIIWGLLFLAGGIVPILGLFNAIGAGVVFNLLLISPKTVYRLTELILDLVGFGEALQVLDKFGLSKTDIHLRGITKVGVVMVDIIFVVWHGIWALAILYYICSYVAIGSNIPIVGGAIDLGARGAEYVSGLPFAQARDFCKSYGALGIPSAVSNVVATASSGCSINQGYCKPEILAEKGQQYGCDWDPTLLSRICTHESSGVSQMSRTDRCNQIVTYPDGHRDYLSWSGGLFQIDIFTATSNIFPACAGLVEPKKTSDDGTGSQFIRSKGSCVEGHWRGNYCDLRECGLKSGVTEAQYQSCVRALNDYEENYRVACIKYKAQGYRAWPDSAQKCGAL